MNTANNEELKLMIISELSRLPVYYANSMNTQHTVRCQYCGDSQTESHGHFSINIDVNDPARPMMYNCLKCGESGLLSRQVLSDLGIELSDDYKSMLNKYNIRSAKYNKYSNKNTEIFYVPEIASSVLIDEKLEYLNNRLGTHISISEASELKIILDFYQFLKVNKINNIPGVNINKAKYIQENFIGFLSNNNNTIVFRNIRNCKKSERYQKIKLNPKNINPRSFYSIPNYFDLLYTNEIHIHIAEGTFDIISVYENVNDGNKEMNLYYAACGFGYTTIIESVVRLGINSNITLHLYSDNDKSDYEHKKYLKKNPQLLLWVDKIFIHRNQFKGEKDYGVPPQRIIDSQCKII